MMGGVFDGFDEIDRAYNDGFDLDISQLCCPKCGFNGCTIVTWPDPRSWWRRTGRARCEFCGAEFAVYALDEKDADD